MTHTTRTTCRLCSGSLRVVLSLPHTPLANDYAVHPDESQEHYPLYICQCESCGHVQLPVVVDPKRLFSSYRYTSSTAGPFKRHIQQLADDIARPGAFIVDIGSNDGLLLAECHARHAQAIGIDPALNLAAEATAAGRLTLPAFATRSLAAQLRNIIARSVTVTALNVFAHSDDLYTLAQAAAELIRHSGTFIFEVAYLPDVLERNEVGTLYHEHLSHHHVAPLVSFFKKHGMTLRHVERLKAQGGSIRGYVGLTSVEDETVQSLIEYERRVIPRLLEEWPKRVAAECTEMAVKLAPYRGKGLAVFGAPARLTPWVYAMQLQHGDVSCVFDDEPRKIGLFTPGLRWPIVSSAELMARNPPAILVASWNYVEDIKRRFPDFRGEWIVPDGRTS
jgi:hypothetical protein